MKDYPFVPSSNSRQGIVQRKEKRETGKELGSFCEAFGLCKIEAPYTSRRKSQKASSSNSNPYKRSSRNKPSHNPDNTSKNQNSMNHIVCYKCGRIGHKANQCYNKEKVNELFADNPDLQSKLLSLLLYETSSNDKEEDGFIHQLDNSDNDSPNSVCVITSNKDQKEFLFDLIGKIPDPDLQREYLGKLKDIILDSDKPRFNLKTNSLKQVLEKYPSQNIFKNITTEELQTDINELKAQVSLL